MFRRIIASDIQNLEVRANELFMLHPSELSALLEMAWSFREKDGGKPLGTPRHRSDLSDIPESILKLFNTPSPPNFMYDANLSAIGKNSVLWDHLIYAYMVENTRVFDIFRKVLYEFLHGEKLGTPQDAETQAWLRNTEEMFYDDPATFSIFNIRSFIRPDINAYRRNNYFRMFGMDLNHGQDDGQPYPYVKAEASNKEFVTTFEEFLQEVWVGISNFSNSTGPKQTDDAAISNLARQLHFMLETRRKNGNLTRSEFCFVSMMSWFHLTLQFDSPIVKSLRADGTSEDQRLCKIAERVGLKAHSKAYDFFQLADPMSRLLSQIELGTYDSPAAVPALYQQGSPQEVDIRTIITHWSIATGRDMKVRRGKNLTTASGRQEVSANGNGVLKEAYLNY